MKWGSFRKARASNGGGVAELAAAQRFLQIRAPSLPAAAAETFAAAAAYGLHNFEPPEFPKAVGLTMLGASRWELPEAAELGDVHLRLLTWDALQVVQWRKRLAMRLEAKQLPHYDEDATFRRWVAERPTGVLVAWAERYGWGYAGKGNRRDAEFLVCRLRPMPLPLLWEFHLSQSVPESELEPPHRQQLEIHWLFATLCLYLSRRHAAEAYRYYFARKVVWHGPTRHRPTLIELTRAIEEHLAQPEVTSLTIPLAVFEAACDEAVSAAREALACDDSLVLDEHLDRFKPPLQLQRCGHCLSKDIVYEVAQLQSIEQLQCVCYAATVADDALCEEDPRRDLRLWAVTALRRSACSFPVRALVYKLWEEQCAVR